MYATISSSTRVHYVAYQTKLHIVSGPFDTILEAQEEADGMEDNHANFVRGIIVDRLNKWPGRGEENGNFELANLIMEDLEAV